MYYIMYDIPYAILAQDAKVRLTVLIFEPTLHSPIRCRIFIPFGSLWFFLQSDVFLQFLLCMFLVICPGE